MKQAKPSIHPNAVIWRISEDAPLGKWVDRNEPRQRLRHEVDLQAPTASWTTSSFDLLDGTDVVEISDSMPLDEFEQLFS